MVPSINSYMYKNRNKVYTVLVYEIPGPWMDRKDAQLQLCDGAMSKFIYVKYKNKVYKVLVYEIFGPWMDRKDAQLQLCNAAKQLWQVTTEHAAVAAAAFEEGKGGAKTN